MREFNRSMYLMKRPFAILLMFLLVACQQPAAKSKGFAPLLAAIECERLTTKHTESAIETRDREFYHPLSVKVIPIRMLKAGDDGYHKPFRGNFVLAIEQYPDVVAARKRAEEYAGVDWWKRLVEPTDPTRDNSTMVSKSSVRCWGTSHGTTAYLLTTHASMCSTLEGKTHFIRSRLDVYLQAGK